MPERGPHKWTLDEEASRPIIKAALERGVTFFDTANVYSDGTSLRRSLGRRQPLLQLSDAHQCRFQPPDKRQQRQDELILLCVAQLAEVGPMRHRKLELGRPRPRQP